jgi:manganese/zinc/iron transport system permease protein
MVLGATCVFALAFLFGPKHGVVVRWWRHRSRSARVQRENTLKSMYHVLEARDFKGEGVSLRELAERRRETIEDVKRQAGDLRSHGLVTLHDEGEMMFLTPGGWQLAASIVRNHRLWELYLTNAAQIAADHVHEDAEKIEHVLGEETVRQLEKRLEGITKDPHGKPIPSLADIRQGAGFAERPAEPSGYGNR